MKSFDPRVWFKKVQMSLMRDGENIDLYANEVQGNNGNSNLTAWIPGGGLAKYLDIYLLDPRIEVVSAQKTGNFLDIKYKLVYVNEVSVVGKEKHCMCIYGTIKRLSSVSRFGQIEMFLYFCTIKGSISFSHLIIYKEGREDKERLSCAVM